MKKFILSIWLCLSASVMLVAGESDAIGQRLAAFESASGQAAAAQANELMRAFSNEQLTEQLIQFPSTAPLDSLRQQVWYWAAEHYYDHADYRHAVSYGERALPLFAGDSKADCLNLLALSYFRMSDYEHAVRYAKECYRLDERTGDPDVMSSSLNTLAGICIGANQPREAEQYILKAIDLAQQAGNLARMAVLQGMASEVYHALGDDRRALAFADRACAIERHLGRDDKLQVRLTQKASVLLGLHRWQEAEQVLQAAIPALRQLGDRHSLGIACNKMGMALLSQQRDREAVPYYREAAAIFAQMGDLGNELHAHRGLYEALWTLNPDSAKIELDYFDLLKDSLYSTATAESLARFNAEFDNDWLQRDLARHRQRVRLAVLAGVLVAALLACAVWWWMRRRSRLREAALQAIIDELRREPQASAAVPEAPATAAPPAAANPSAPAPPAMADREFLDRLVGHVRAMMEQGDVSVDRLADHMCLTRGHLNRRVKALTGVTTQQYALRVRLEYARQLMEREPALTIAEVADRCGFGDAAAFSRAFKRTFGASPSQHRALKA